MFSSELALYIPTYRGNILHITVKFCPLFAHFIISWSSLAGVENAGKISFEPTSQNRTRIY